MQGNPTMIMMMAAMHRNPMAQQNCRLVDIYRRHLDKKQTVIDYLGIENIISGDIQHNARCVAG